MPSNSILLWRGPGRGDLDDIVDAHTSVAGVGRGGRGATAHLTQESPSSPLALAAVLPRSPLDAIEHVAVSGTLAP